MYKINHAFVSLERYTEVSSCLAMIPLPPATKQLLRFLVVGCCAVLTDYLSYTLFLTFLTHTPAKSLSFILGTIVAYFLNKYWTFERPEHNHTEVIKFIALYGSTLGANVAVNYLTLSLFPGLILLAFVAATGTSTVLNFIGQKWWVFTHKL